MGIRGSQMTVKGTGTIQSFTTGSSRTERKLAFFW